MIFKTVVKSLPGFPSQVRELKDDLVRLKYPVLLSKKSHLMQESAKAFWLQREKLLFFLSVSKGLLAQAWEPGTKDFCILDKCQNIRISLYNIA